MNKIFISTVEKDYPEGILRHYFTQFMNSFSIFEEEDIHKNAVCILNYSDLILNKYDGSLSKIAQSNCKILIRHDFGINVNKLLEKIYSILNIVDSKNICIQVAYFYEKKLLEEHFSKHNIFDIKIFVFDPFMNNVYQRLPVYENLAKEKTENKFSAFSRRYDDSRFLLYLELVKRNILLNFTYTFSNGHAETRPYPYTCIEIEELQSLAEKYGYNNNQITNWIKGIPYTDLQDFHNPYATAIHTLLNTADINLVLETSIFQDIANRDITEKTYKPIIAKKPFLLFGTNDSLQVLLKEGYKTFSPFINEQYADIGQNKNSLLFVEKKIQAICDELERINNLCQEDYENLLGSLQNVVEHNYNHFCHLSVQKDKSLSEMFEHLEFGKLTS